MGGANAASRPQHRIRQPAAPQAARLDVRRAISPQKKARLPTGVLSRAKVTPFARVPETALGALAEMAIAHFGQLKSPLANRRAMREQESRIKKPQAF